MKMAVLCASVFAFTGFAVFAQDADSFEYKKENGGIIITGYTGIAKDVVIPARVDNLPVAAIGDKAFSSKQLASVTIQNSVTAIGMGAFHGKKLTSVTLPANVEIQYNSFYAVLCGVMRCYIVEFFLKREFYGEKTS
ncbi:MAG: leucine-rich repeat domain-containing protein [Treponema sp.]|jgi:hypothetical protein|nr:leucine-rich repeat domain-containing protein [Treponema sp.]